MIIDLKYVQDAHAQARFFTGDTVTIKIYDITGTDITPTSPDNQCAEIGTTGFYRWPYANLQTFPTEYQEYLWTMTNQSGQEQSDVDVFYDIIVPNTVFLTPFDVFLHPENGKSDINKGDSWATEIRIDSTSENIKVAVELTDLTTTIYKYTSNIAGGGDDQVKLIAAGDTFQIFKLYLTEDDTELFDSRFVDMIVTMETDAGTQTLGKPKKIPFTTVPAITFNPIS